MTYESIPMVLEMRHELAVLLSLYLQGSKQIGSIGTYKCNIAKVRNNGQIGSPVMSQKLTTSCGHVYMHIVSLLL